MCFEPVTSRHILQRLQIFEQLLPNGLTGANGQREFTLRPGQPASLVQNTLSDGPQREEIPARRPFGLRPAHERARPHLEFPAEVVGQHARKGEDFVAYAALGGHEVHSSILLGLAEDLFLGSTTMMEAKEVPTTSRHLEKPRDP